MLYGFKALESKEASEYIQKWIICCEGVARKLYEEMGTEEAAELEQTIAEEDRHLQEVTPVKLDANTVPRGVNM